jgi:hypothetical protein
MLVVPALLNTVVFAEESSEVAELRGQLDAVTQRLDEIEREQKEEASPAPPEKTTWIDKLTFKGDVRIRYENRQIDSHTSNSRMRFRARVGVYTDVADQIFGGIRVASGSSDEATSANQSFDSWAFQKNAWIDLAYLGYAPAGLKGFELQAGKIKRPWIDVDTLIWDHDVNPEGASLTYTVPVGPVSLFTHLGHFIMVEQTSDDVQMTSGQLAASMDVSEQAALRVGGTAFVWDNIRGAKTPGSPNRNYGNGNTTTTDGTDFYYDTGFKIGQLFYDLTLKTKMADIIFYGEYMKNLDAIDAQDTAWLAGVGAKRGKWACSYSFRDVQNNATVAYFMDSDFAGSQISSGHRINAKYNLTKNFNFGLNYAIANTYLDKDDNTLLLDAVLKF